VGVQITGIPSFLVRRKNEHRKLGTVRVGHSVTSEVDDVVRRRELLEGILSGSVAGQDKGSRVEAGNPAALLVDVPERPQAG
jgi:hypothetical protein